MPSGLGSSDPLLACSDGDGTADGAGGAVDHRGVTGGWKSARFIIAVEIAERFAFDGVWFNLISYLTGPLGEGNAAAAAAINAWAGVSQLLPLLGGALADNCLGRYRTIALASMLYVLGLGMLALSTLLSTGECTATSSAGGKTCSPSNLQVALFYMSLYLVAVAEGGFKPCLQAFGADQFDPSDPSRSSFFNWWYLGIRAGGTVTYVVLSYVQDNVGWGLGFGIPCAITACSLVVFLLGTRTYRYYDEKVTSGGGGGPPRQASDCKDAKAVLRLFPIWATCLVYAVALAQSSTFFTKQAATLDRRVGNLKVPPAALQSFIGVTIVAFIPVYDPVLGDHAPAHRRRDAAVGRVHGPRGARGGAPPPAGPRRRDRGQPGGHRPDEPVVDGAAVRAVRRRRRLHRRRPAGVLLRPGARHAAQPRPGALPQHLGRWQLHKQRAGVGHRQGHCGKGAELVRQQSQPRPPRLLLLAARRAKRVRAPRLPLLRGDLQVQEEGSPACRLVMTDSPDCFEHSLYSEFPLYQVLENSFVFKRRVCVRFVLTFVRLMEPKTAGTGPAVANGSNPDLLGRVSLPRNQNSPSIRSFISHHHRQRERETGEDGRGERRRRRLGSGERRRRRFGSGAFEGCALRAITTAAIYGCCHDP